MAEFFAGSGLVTEGLRHDFDVVWANDISIKKKNHYCQNFGEDSFVLSSISDITGATVPKVDLVWSSFPCQDLSLAGKMRGMQGTRSGMFWEWLRVLDELPVAPNVICLENVPGLLSARDGNDYKIIHRELRNRGFAVGSILLDALEWVPQSRKRIFIIAVKASLDSSIFQDIEPNWAHPPKLVKVCRELERNIWWKIPYPENRGKTLSDIIEWDAPTFPKDKTENLLKLLPESHRNTMEEIASISKQMVFPGYRRTRNRKQTLELRFDNISGCLRTAEGGSSRQFLVIWKSNKWSSRLLTSREAARLMGAPDSYKLSEIYNDAYTAMGDAVAVPVVKHLSKHLLKHLSQNIPTLQNVTTETPKFCLQA